MEQIPAERPVTLPQFELHFEAKTLEFRMGLRSIHRDENRSKACNSGTRIKLLIIRCQNLHQLGPGANTFGHYRRRHALGWRGRQPESLELFRRPGPSSCRLPRPWVPVSAPELRSPTLSSPAKRQSCDRAADDTGNSDGSNSTIICQDIAMTLARPLLAVVSRTVPDCTRPLRPAPAKAIRYRGSPLRTPSTAARQKRRTESPPHQQNSRELHAHQRRQELHQKQIAGLSVIHRPTCNQDRQHGAEQRRENAGGKKRQSGRPGPVSDSMMTGRTRLEG